MNDENEHAHEVENQKRRLSSLREGPSPTASLRGDLE